jgi:LPXTG-motif cell wall-anchored protein
MTLGNSGYVIVLDKVSRKTVAAGVTAGAVVLVLAGWLLWRRKHRKTETKETEEKK